jgi:hypothetical protein
MSRGGELGVHEKQKEALDSSTRGMNFGKMFTFTFDQSVKSTPPARSTKYFSKQLATLEDDNIKQVLGISHPLEDPVAINGYTIVQNRMNMVDTYATTHNYSKEAQKFEVLQQTLTALSDVRETLRNEKDILIGNEISVYLNQQQKFWNEVGAVLEKIVDIAVGFYAEKKQ